MNLQVAPHTEHRLGARFCLSSMNIASGRRTRYLGNVKRGGRARRASEQMRGPPSQPLPRTSPGLGVFCLDRHSTRLTDSCFCHAQHSPYQLFLDLLFFLSFFLMHILSYVYISKESPDGQSGAQWAGTSKPPKKATLA